MKKLLHIILATALALLAAIGMQGCSESKVNEEPEVPEELEVPEVPEEPEPEPDSRTVLVYLAADNNLGSRDFDTMDIDEILSAVNDGVLDDDNRRLIIFHSRTNKAPQLIEIKADGTQEVVKEYDMSLSSVSAAMMTNVINDTKNHAKAAQYGMILWSHGSGWLKKSEPATAAASAASPKAYGYDSRGKSMNIPTLAGVLKDQDIDFLYFDCCYMGAIEVAYELRDVTDYIVFSPTEIPNEGMPYDKNLECFFDHDIERGLIQAATNTFEDYNERTDYNRSCTMSVVRTSALDQLAEATRDIFENSYLALPEGYTPQKYMSESTCYHFDFADYVRALCVDPLLLAEFEDALSETVIYENATPYMWKGYQWDSFLITINTHCGLSTYIMKSAADATTQGYNTTAWYADVASALKSPYDI